LNLPTGRRAPRETAETVAPGVARVRPAVFRTLPASAPAESAASRGPSALRAYAPSAAPQQETPVLRMRPRGVPAAPVQSPLNPALLPQAPATGGLEQYLAPLRGLSRELVSRGMPSSLVAQLLSEIVAEFGNQVLGSEQDARHALVEQILLRISGIPLVRTDTPLFGCYLVCGPAGSGKSVLISHLALTAARQGRREVILVNTEGERIGAAAQMNALGAVFGYPVTHLYSPQELHALQAQCAPGTLLLVEAGSWSPANDSGRQRNAWGWRLPDAQNVVCVPATSHAEDVSDLLRASRQSLRDPVAVLTRTGDTRSALPAIGALAAVRQPVSMVVPGPNLMETTGLLDLGTVVRMALAVVTRNRKRG